MSDEEFQVMQMVLRHELGVPEMQTAPEEAEQRNSRAHEKTLPAEVAPTKAVPTEMKSAQQNAPKQTPPPADPTDAGDAASKW